MGMGASIWNGDMETGLKSGECRALVIGDLAVAVVDGLSLSCLTSTRRIEDDYDSWSRGWIRSGTKSRQTGIEESGVDIVVAVPVRRVSGA